MIKWFYKKSLVVLILFLALTACQTTPEVNDQQRVNDFAHRSENLIRQQLYKEAVAELNEGLKLEPNALILIQQMGRAQALNQNYEEAEKNLKRAEKMNPKDPMTFGYYGMMYFNRRMFKEARENYLKAHNLTPEEPYYFFHIAVCSVLLGERDTAAQFATRYLKSGDDIALKRRMTQMMKQAKIEIQSIESPVVSLLEEKKFSEVEKFLQGLKDSKKVDENGDSELSLAYRDIRQMERVRDILKEWEIKEPKSAFAKGLLGASFIDFAWEARGTGYINSVTANAMQAFEERLSQAKIYLEQSRNLDKTNLETVSDLMLVAKARKSTRHEVKPIFEMSIRSEPDYFLAQKQMMETLNPKWGGTVSEMLEFSRTQAANSPENSKAPILVPLAHWEVAYIYYSNNLKSYFAKKSVWQECASALETAIKRFPNSVEIRTLYVRTAFYAGDLAAAKAQYAVIKDQLAMKYWTGGYPELSEVKRGLASE